MRTTGIVRYSGMVAKRMRAWEASGYRRRQPLEAADTRGVLEKPRPLQFDKIFDKPQPPRVQSTQILVSILTSSSALAPDFIRGFPAEYLIAHSVRAVLISIAHRDKFRDGGRCLTKLQQSSAPVFRDLERGGKLRQAVRCASCVPVASRDSWNDEARLRNAAGARCRVACARWPRVRCANRNRLGRRFRERFAK